MSPVVTSNTHTYWLWDALEQKFTEEIEDGEISEGAQFSPGPEEQAECEDECGPCAGSGFKWLEWCQDVADCDYCGGCGVAEGGAE